MEKERDQLIQARKEFLNLKFGMFIHFGLYSQGKDHEWHIYNYKMSVSDYKDQFLNSFNPDPKGIEEWVINAKKMGAKYIVCTAKHGDGFCLWDTKYKHPLYPEYHIRNTEFYRKNKKGILDYLFEAGRKHDIKIGLYYCVIDWSWTRKKKKRPPAHTIKDKKLLQKFVNYMKNQLCELIELWPETLTIWLDGHVFYKNGLIDLDYEGLYQQLHSKKEDILVGSNSATTSKEKKYSKTDFLIFENMAHKGEMNPVLWPRNDPEQLPAEVCLTINNHWGYNEQDKEYKSIDAITKLVQENSVRKGNTLLNFGPKPNGYIAEDQTDLISEIGRKLY